MRGTSWRVTVMRTSIISDVERPLCPFAARFGRVDFSLPVTYTSLHTFRH